MDLPVLVPGPAPADSAGPSRRPPSLATRVLLIAVNLAVATVEVSYSRLGLGLGRYRLDLDVYRIAGQAWLRHADLYGTLPATSAGIGLPFSYPPIAAVAMSLLALLPLAVDGALLTLAGIMATALVLRLFLRSAAGPRAASWRTIGWLLPIALFLQPVRDTLNFGQVNIVLMALVAVDCLPVAVRWPRGAGVGIAAAVKLTPAAFVLFFLCRGDRRAAGTAAVSFAAITASGFLLAGHDSLRYWTSVVFQTGRPGSPVYAANQSIQGVIGRAGLDPRTPAGTAVWLALSAVVLLLTWIAMRRAIARSEHAWALCLNAFAALLISPISWSHHWVWGEAALLVLGLHALRRADPGVRAGSGVPVTSGVRAGAGLAAGLVAGLAVFAASPQSWFPSGGNRELQWTAWQQVLGDSYVILAAVTLAASVYWLRPGGSYREASLRKSQLVILSGTRRSQA